MLSSLRSRLVRVCVRCESTARPLHPVAQLSRDLTQALRGPLGANDAYKTFKDGLYELSQSLDQPEHTLQRSFGLNSVLVQLLEASKAGLKGSAARDGGDATTLPPNPYEILATMCENNLARDAHFEVVLEYLLLGQSPQDVLGLWVKYLETIAENPKAVTYGAHHTNNMALASIGYLFLPDNVPDLSVVAQVLKQDGHLDKIPFSRIRYLLGKLPFTADVRNQASHNLDQLMFQFAHTNKPSFLQHLKSLRQEKDVYHLFQTYARVAKEANKPMDPEVVAAFMTALVHFGKPQLALNCFNTTKQQGDPELPVDNALLVTVASLPVSRLRAREEKLKRIEAIWNSVILPRQATVDVSSYNALATALGISRNCDKVQQLWNQEIPAKMKEDQELLEAYLTALCGSRDTALEDIKNKLPARINSIKLANAVLARMAKEKSPESEIDSFYRAQFTDADAPLQPNFETLGIKMYVNSLNTNNPEFQFLRSISKSKKDINTTNAIFERFIKVCPDIETIRKLFLEIEEPLDAKKYGLMIFAEFYNGNYAEAETVFKKFVTKAKSLNMVSRAILDPIINGFCDLCLKSGDAGYLSRVELYMQIAKKARGQLSYNAASRVVYTLATMAKNRKSKFTAQELKHIETILQDILEMENFTPLKKNLDILKENGVSIPERQ